MIISQNNLIIIIVIVTMSDSESKDTDELAGNRKLLFEKTFPTIPKRSHEPPQENTIDGSCPLVH